MRQEIKSRIEEIKRGGVPDGYRKTPVGVFPCDWEEKQIGKVLKIKHGRSQKEVENPNGQYPILATSGQIGRSDKFLYDKPSVLIGRKGTIDKPFYMDTPFWTVDTLFYSQVFNNYNAKYIYYIFNMINWKKYDESTGVPSLSAKGIESITYMFSKLLAEQKKIAEILMVCDEGIELEEKLIKKLEERKKALMQKLLTPQPHWQISELGKICKIKKGIQISKVDLWDKGEFPVINGGIQPSGFYNKYNTNENTITISEGGNSCGYVNYIRQKFWSGGHCYTISNSKINDLYLYAYLKYIQTEIMNLRVGSGLPNVQKNAVERIKINYPKEIERQISIGELFNCIDKTEKLHILKLEKLKSRRKVLMQLLLTGIVRVGE